MQAGIISSIKHVSSKEQLADTFTKKGAFLEPLLEVLQKGKFHVTSSYELQQ